MFFRYNNNSLNQISRGFAKGLFVIGLLLIGFGTLVWILKEFLAIVAAAIFIIVGVGCCFKAVRLFFITSGSNSAKTSDDGRENVSVRIDL